MSYSFGYSSFIVFVGDIIIPNSERNEEERLGT